MKKILFLVVLIQFVLSVATYATTWQIEVGGGGDNGTPYFSPQNLTIMQDDIVEWVWVSGIHDVLSTSGPESFASGTHFAPHTFSYEFFAPGIYDYICSYLEHSATQFGTITVSPLAVVNAVEREPFDFVVSPNPTSDFLKISRTSSGLVSLRVLDATGRLVYNSVYTDMNFVINLGELQRGIYYVELSTGTKSLTRRISLI